MPHWVETYPHTIWASVILKDNKISDWKIGQNRLSQKYNIQSLHEAHPEYTYEEHSWEVSDDDEHSDVFDIHASEWFRQWELHEDFIGSKPYEDKPDVFSEEMLKKASFNWSDLDGKTLKIHVASTTDGTCAIGTNEEGREYVLYCNPKAEGAPF